MIIFTVLFLISMQAMTGEISIRDNEDISCILENNNIIYIQNGNIISTVSEDEIYDAIQMMPVEYFMHKYSLKNIYRDTGKIHLRSWEQMIPVKDYYCYPDSVLKRYELKYAPDGKTLIDDTPLPEPKDIKTPAKNEHFKILVGVLTIGSNIVFNMALKDLVYSMTDKLCKKPNNTPQSIEKYNKFRKRVLTTTRVVFNVTWLTGVVLLYKMLSSENKAK